MEQEEFREENIHWLEEFMATVRQSLILENQYVEKKTMIMQLLLKLHFILKFEFRCNGKSN